MAEGTGTSQSSDYQHTVVMMGPRVGASPLPQKPSAQFGKAARGWLFAVRRIGSYAALVNPPERGRTDVVLTGPQPTH